MTILKVLLKKIPFQVEARILTNKHPCRMYGTKAYQWRKYGRY